jgi:hypothetical protein
LRDAHPGTAVNTLRSINPSLQRDDKPGQIIVSLDPFTIRVNSGKSFLGASYSDESARGSGVEKAALYRGGQILLQ